MSLKKFLAPNIAILIVLSTFWLAGIDTVFRNGNDDRENIQKYIQVQRKIVDNYVDQVDITKLYKNSIRGLVANLSDSAARLEGTPVDTSFGDLEVEDLRESVIKFEAAYLYVANNYPGENMTARTEDAIRGMFKTLDPHSIYIEPEESEVIEEEFAGKFQGIGIYFNIIQDTITVITPISGGPSDQLGIRSGDRIVEIEDSSSVGFSKEDVVNTLRGPKGTKVDIKIKRPHVDELMKFTITRDDIPLYTVDTAYMLDDITGYVKINRFAATTHEEFMDAMEKLKDKGMKRIILDLRGNPGGYLGQAIAIAEEFFPRGTKLVSTKSRHTRFTSTYHSRKDGKFKDEPVMILVNEGSASASEIVSGAIQDHDRGLIVGRRTFGKGLVQQQYGLVDSSKIRVTISRYYTPSGRLIQKPYSKGREAYAYEIYKREDNAVTDVSKFISHIPDSLRYSTDAGRTVYGGGGVVPDHVVVADTSRSAAVFNFMRRKQIEFNFVRDYLDQNAEAFRARWEDSYQKFRTEFKWTDENIDKVFTRLKENGLVISGSIEKPDFKSDKLYIPKGHLEKVEWMPRGLMKAELAKQVWGFKKYYQIFNDIFDTTLKKAKDMWGEVRALKEYVVNHQEPVLQRELEN